tara:strand:- start:592 stop:1578 length:987 start_codon:yes stop_codon:yes gene_type:complete
VKYYEGKNVLVTGGTGLIGRPLVRKLFDCGAEVSVVSLDEPTDLADDIKFLKADLRELSSCLECCENIDVVFQLAGIKGSPKMCAEKPASFLVPTIQFSFNMMEAARRRGVERYLYTSSVGVYAPAATFYEDDVWKTFPSPNDRFAGWAKRMGELQAEAYRIENNWENISVVRPANVYGRYDNFDPENAMVIPSLINKALSSKNVLEVWGDGSPVRDFIHADDVADGMMSVVEQSYNQPVNLGSGCGVRIADVAKSIAANVPNGPLDIKWDTSKPSGDAKRLMDVSRAESIGIRSKVNLERGIRDTIEWYVDHREIIGTRYNSFTENS